MLLWEFNEYTLFSPFLPFVSYLKLLQLIVRIKIEILLIALNFKESYRNANFSYETSV